MIPLHTTYKTTQSNTTRNWLPPPDLSTTASANSRSPLPFERLTDALWRDLAISMTVAVFTGTFELLTSGLFGSCLTVTTAWPPPLLGLESGVVLAVRTGNNDDTQPAVNATAERHWHSTVRRK